MKFKSFTILELVIVIIVISIIAVKTNFILSDTSLNQAADQIITNINYTRELALKDNKFQYYPINSTNVELNRTKYWFKQWWQIRFTKNKNDPKDLWYEIFTDVPYNTSSNNFDGLGNTPTTQWDKSFAKIDNKYLIGHCGTTGYPTCEDANSKLNLTKSYSIKKILFNNSEVVSNNSKRLIFDNYGNVYLSEGETGDGGDINPYDKDERTPLIKKIKITLCKEDNCEKNISICITPKVGFAYICK